MWYRIWTCAALILGLELGLADPATPQAPDTALGTQVAAQPKNLNPYTGDTEAIAEGRKLYLKYNCYGCHGTMGGGGMGKPINDEEWLYGGDDASVLASIQDGTPGGMPEYRELVSEDDAWKIIAYIRSFYRGDPATASWAAPEGAADRATGAAAAAAAVSGEAVGEVSSATEQPKKLNPYTGNTAVIAEGRKLYLKYNCYGCHGTMGGGGMGKPINDTEWLYGGDDASVMRTIQGGRQGGMPVFQELITEDEIWKIIAYVRSFYKGDPSAVSW